MILTTILIIKMTNLMIALMGAVKHPSMQHPMAPPSPNAFQLVYMLPVYSIGERISSTRWLKKVTETCIYVVLTDRGNGRIIVV